MIEVAEIENIHNILIDKFGGSKGVRDRGLLDSSIKRAYQTFDGRELYPEPVDKAASTFESLIQNHPFVDGNKRIAYVAMRMILLESGMDIKATQADKYNFVVRAAQGELTIEMIKEWIKSNLD